jgi:uncharacterized protein (TIGR03118 family)
MPRTTVWPAEDGIRGTQRRGTRGTRTAGARLWRVSGVLAAGAAAALALPAGTGLASAHPGITFAFARTDLVSDNPRLTPTVDPNVINPWGVSEFPHGPLWVSNEGHANTTLYSGADSTSAKLNPVGLVVSIPGGRPTGQAFNTTSTGPTPGFAVTDGKNTASARFLFATLNGVIAGWEPTVGATMAGVPSSTAEQGTKVPGAVFTGLAQAGNRLYAADVAHRSVDVFGPDFKQLMMPGAFQDRLIPRRFSPFNVAAVNGQIVVTYSSPHASLGGGFVDVFTPDGVLVKRLIRSGLLNQPWGVAMAPSSWGQFAGDLLVGNHGNGLINAFDPATGRYAGTIRVAGGRPFVAPGLWGLIFGDGPAAPGGPPSAGFPSTLFFTVGATFGRHGVIGEITPVT